MVDAFVYHFFFPTVNFRSCFSHKTTAHHEARNQWPLFSLPWSLTSSEWQWRRNLPRQQRQADRARGEERRREAEKRYRQTWSGDRTKEKGRITVNKKKTPTTTLCQCQVSKKTPHESQREVSHNMHLNHERPIQTLPRWDGYCRVHCGIAWLWGKQKRGGEGMSNTGLVSIMLSVWNPNSLLLSLAHPVSHFWRFASSPLNPVYLFICMENIGHAFIQGHTFLIVLQL